MNDSKIAAWPEGHAKLVNAAGVSRSQATKVLADPEAKVTRGNRHHELIRLAGTFRSRGLPFDMALSAVQTFNATRCDPPYSERDVETKVADIYERYPDGVAARNPPEPEVEWNGDLGGLLADTCTLVRKYIVLSPGGIRVCALIVAQSYIWEHLDYVAYLDIHSAVRQCGKSHLRDVLAALSRRSELMGSHTPAVLYRLIEEKQPTLFLDEVDNYLKNAESERNAEILGLLNEGFERGNKARRMGGPNRDELKEFDIFCPKVFASIGTLPDTLRSRSIRVKLERCTKDEQPPRLRKAKLRADAAPIAARWLAWAGTLSSPEVFQLPDERIPAELDGREADIFEPLLAVADMAGGSWASEVRKEAVRLSAGKDAEDENAGVHLLADIRAAFADDEHVSTKDLLALLTENEESRWAEWSRGLPLSARSLSRLLRPFGIKPKKIRTGDRTLQGYERKQFEEAWSRYTPVYPEHSEQSSFHAGLSAVSTRNTSPAVPDRKGAANPHESKDVPDVPDKSPSDSDEAETPALDPGTATMDELRAHYRETTE